MTDQQNPPDVPAELGTAGAAFWLQQQSESEFDSRESALLIEACRTLDRIAALDAVIEEDGLMIIGSTGQKVLHPAVAELRQQQASFGRLLGSIEWEDEEQAKERFRHNRAKAGATARWGSSTPERRLQAVTNG